MTGWPVPTEYPITTAYGKRGSSWSCHEDSNGKGVHTGVDMACPSNTNLYATVAGTIRHRNYGSAFGDRQFAISPSAGQPFANGEVFYAHGNERLADGTEVQVGDYVGKSGARGNVSGPHLHYEFHPDTKNAWNCGVYADPAPTLSTSGSSPYVTKDVYRSKCGYGEPTNGDAHSDTVKELQNLLNHIRLEGGQTLTITGTYDVDTDDEVRKWQEQIVHDPPDPVKKSYLGPSQFRAMFSDTIYTLHDDGDPAIAGGSEGSGGTTPPPVNTDGSNTTLGQWLKAQGWVVHDSDVPLGRESTWRKVEFLMVHHTGSPGNCTSNPADMAEYIRHSDDPDTYPPLAQLLIDQKGELWPCSRERDGQPAPGRASHAGTGHGYGIPDDTMNERCLGTEHMCDGTHPLSTHKVMYEASLRLHADLRTYFNVPKDKVIGHKEWSTSGKTDPKDDMNAYRNAVEKTLNPPTPVPPDPPEPPESITFPLGIEYWYSGKPEGTFTFAGDKKYLDIPAWAPKKKGFTFGMIYANVDIDGEFRSYLARLNPVDETALQTHFGDEGGDNYTLTHVWFEKGEAGRQLRYGLYSQDGQTGTVTTRYVKFLAIPESVFVDLGNVLGAYSVARTTYNVTKEHLPKAVIVLFIAWVVKQIKEMKAGTGG